MAASQAHPDTVTQTAAAASARPLQQQHRQQQQLQGSLSLLLTRHPLVQPPLQSCLVGHGPKAGPSHHHLLLARLQLQLPMLP